jgi:hypothetical protein
MRHRPASPAQATEAGRSWHSPGMHNALVVHCDSRPVMLVDDVGVTLVTDDCSGETERFGLGDRR